MSSDPEQEYFSDGITEEIITDLSHVQDLLVISRSSVTAFKNTNKNVKEIARELNVHYLLQGSVRKAGDNLRITTQLIDARRDANVWAEKYSGTLDDVFDIQEKVSRSIVEALKLKLTRAEDKQISDRPIADINAYDHYLRARRELHKWNPEAFDNARKHIERAMEIVGPNAVLYGAMGYLYWNYANLGIEPELNYEKAQEFANKSFLIDHDSPSAHLIKANINIMYLGNPIEGVKHLDKILHTNPHDFDAMMWKGIIYMMWGKKDECELIGSKMYQLDPLNAVCHALRGGVDFYTGNFDTAIAPMLRAHEIEPENSIFQMFIPFCYAYNQEFPQAISFIENKMNPDTKGFILEAGLMLKSALLKQQDKVIDWIAEIPKNVHKDPQYSHFVGSLCAFAGLNDEAIHWLENAINSGFYNYPFLAEHEFAYKHLRNDRRYLELLQEAKREWKKIPLQE
jgi:TolB-like protein